MFVTQLPQWLWCWDSGCCLEGLALRRRERGITVVAHQTAALGIQEFKMLWCFRGAGIGISSDSGQRRGRVGHVPMTPLLHTEKAQHE